MDTLSVICCFPVCPFQISCKRTCGRTCQCLWDRVKWSMASQCCGGTCLPPAGLRVKCGPVTKWAAARRWRDSDNSWQMAHGHKTGRDIGYENFNTEPLTFIFTILSNSITYRGNILDVLCKIFTHKSQTNISYHWKLELKIKYWQFDGYTAWVCEDWPMIYNYFLFRWKWGCLRTSTFSTHHVLW